MFQLHRKFLCLPVLVALFVLCLSLICPSVGASRSTCWISLPVFFATTRAYDVENKAFTGGRGFKDDTQGVRYGVATITLDVQDWENVAPDARRYLHVTVTPDTNHSSCEIHELSRDDFFAQLRARHERGTKHESCIFVHGYNSSFAGAVDSAARLEIALDEPVVLFSWPSANKLKDYTVDECNAEWSERGFQIFMHGVESEIGSDQLMTVSHSMGNRLINWYMASRYDSSAGKPSHFKEVVLTSPDIDRGTFKNYFYKVASNSDKTRIYVSSKDMPLRLSGFVHGSAREGAVAAVDDPKWDKPGDVPNTETINFTAADSGPIGHSIQFEIISHMHKDNEPGLSFNIVKDDTAKRSYFRVERTARSSKD